ncbi:RsbRD N-terminal domain-containing protein [Thermodesulfovibrio sp.]|uniref:RsbRD N-terminal domain-containing protein n=1 Tax=Thermodesulfovibrio sp. TaxID=2067987 RepID=UPI0030B7DA74
MSIRDFLSKKRKAIVNKSFELTVSTYPEESQSFLKDNSRQFTNPIGYNLYQSIEQIVEKIINEEPIDNFITPLEEIIRIRAVQDFTPSQAVGFIFLIKKAFQDELEKEIEPLKVLDFLSRIDSLTLIAFDIFMKYREKIYDLKSKELIDRTWWILKKWNIVSEIPDKTVETK